MRLSIITVNLNNKSDLKITIDSIKSQSFKDFEYIIIDGGSTDGSLEVIKQNSDIVDFWISEPDQGIYDAMNKAINIAVGEYCFFINSGDYLYSNDILLKIFNKGIEADLIYGNVIFALHDVIYDGFFDYTKFLYKNICHQSIFYKRKVLLENNLFDTKYRLLADYVLNIQLFINDFKIYYIDEIISVYQGGGQSETSIDFNFIEDYFQIVSKPLLKRVSANKIIIANYNFYLLLINNTKISALIKFKFAWRLFLFSRSFGLFLLAIRRLFIGLVINCYLNILLFIRNKIRRFLLAIGVFK